MKRASLLSLVVALSFGCAARADGPAPTNPSQSDTTAVREVDKSQQGEAIEFTLDENETPVTVLEGAKLLPPGVDGVESFTANSLSQSCPVTAADAKVVQLPSGGKSVKFALNFDNCRPIVEVAIVPKKKVTSTEAEQVNGHGKKWFPVCQPPTVCPVIPVIPIYIEPIAPIVPGAFQQAGGARIEAYGNFGGGFRMGDYIPDSGKKSQPLDPNSPGSVITNTDSLNAHVENKNSSGNGWGMGGQNAAGGSYNGKYSTVQGQAINNGTARVTFTPDMTGSTFSNNKSGNAMVNNSNTSGDNWGAGGENGAGGNYNGHGATVQGQAIQNATARIDIGGTLVNSKVNNNESFNVSANNSNSSGTGWGAGGKEATSTGGSYNGVGATVQGQAISNGSGRIRFAANMLNSTMKNDNSFNIMMDNQNFSGNRWGAGSETGPGAGGEGNGRGATVQGQAISNFNGSIFVGGDFANSTMTNVNSGNVFGRNYNSSGSGWGSAGENGNGGNGNGVGATVQGQAINNGSGSVHIAPNAR
jgi:hypothetical protein